MAHFLPCLLRSISTQWMNEWMHRGDRATLVRIRSLLESDHVHRSSILVHIFGTDLSCYITHYCFLITYCNATGIVHSWPSRHVHLCPSVNDDLPASGKLGQFDASPHRSIHHRVHCYQRGGREWIYSDSPSSEAFHCPLLPLLSILRVDFFFPLSTIHLSNPVCLPWEGTRDVLRPIEYNSSN